MLHILLSLRCHCQVHVLLERAHLLRDENLFVQELIRCGMGWVHLHAVQ